MAAIPETSARRPDAPGPNVEPTKTPKKKGPGYAKIHAKSVPVEIHPLPAFHPSNPISLLRLAYTWISHLLWPPTSHPAHPYVGYFSLETRSVHVTDPKHVRALWEMGFFGKGTLSRSEPTWLNREKARLRKERSGKAAAEDVTNERREERRLFKLERARAEREKIERQRLIEEGKMVPDATDVLEIDESGHKTVVSNELQPSDPSIDATEMSENLKNLELNSESQPEIVPEVSGLAEGTFEEQTQAAIAIPAYDAQDSDINGTSKKINPLLEAEPLASPTTHTTADQTAEFALLEEVEELEPDIEDQEHLQLTLEEAFFLSYGLGVLEILPPTLPDSPPVSPKHVRRAYQTKDLLAMFCQHSFFQPSTPTEIAPDDQFMLNYVVYHHFRSLGWVIRPGLKFSVDYLLYNRGPVFSHAEFAVLIIPAYSNRYWNTPGGRSRRRVQDQKDWWWLHCVNRVQSQVKKTLVLCYVDIPSPFDWDLEGEGGVDIGALLKGYKVREFVIRRWLANRTRD